MIERERDAVGTEVYKKNTLNYSIKIILQIQNMVMEKDKQHCLNKNTNKK